MPSTRMPNDQPRRARGGTARRGCTAAWVYVLLLAGSATSRAEEPGVPRLERLRETVRTLSSAEYEGRGTLAGRRRTREYLIARFRALGLSPLFPEESFEQTVPGPRSADAPPDSPRPIYGHNVGAWLPASGIATPPAGEKTPSPAPAEEGGGEVVILSAHFDHLGMPGGRLHPGADDNASGVAMLLEAARLLAERKPAVQNRRIAGIAFLAFDLEEHMLWGSRWFAAHAPWPLERVRLFMTADMIGRSLGNLPLATVYVMGTERGKGLPERVRSSARLVEQGPRPLELSLLGVDLVGTRSDYGPFRDAKVPFLFFSSGEHPDYHTPRDTFDRVDFDKVAAVTRVMADVALQTAEAEPRPVFRDAEPLGLEEVRVVRRIVELLLERDDAVVRGGGAGLGALRRTLVTGVRTECDRLIALGKVEPKDRAWLIRSAQALLATVF